MKTNTIEYPAVRRSKRRKHVLRINLFFGGAKAPLLALHLKSQSAINVVFDNQHELELLKEEFPDQQFFTFAMGYGSTMWSMNANHITGNSTTHGGFGARLKNAKLAAEQLTKEGDFEQFSRGLPTEILTRCRGIVSLLEVTVYGSIAGSACAGGSLEVVEALLPAMLRLECPIQLTCDLLGPSAFLGIAERARINAASALLSQLAFLLNDSPKLDLVAKTLQLHELPPFQDDSRRRNQILMLDAVAMDGVQMQDYLRLIRPNLSNSSRYGNLLSRQVDFMTGLDAEKHIASRVSQVYGQTLQDMTEAAQADPQLVDELRWQDVSEDHDREDLNDICARLEEPDYDELLRAVMKPPADHRFLIFAQTAHGSEFLLEQLSSDFSVTPTLLDDFLLRLKLLRTFERMITADLDWVRRESRKLQTSIAELKEQFARGHQKLIRRSYVSRKGLLGKLKVVSVELRKQGDQLALRQAEGDALDRARVAIEHELKHHVETLEQIVRQLDEFVPRGSLQRTPSFIVTRHISDVFPQLVALPHQSREQQIATLCSAAAQLLSEGLAKIVGATSDRLESIARAIVHGEYDVVGPPHGGRQRQHLGKPIYVLPPLDARSEEQLPGLIRLRSPDAKVLFSDTLEFGAAVARIHLYGFSSVGEIFAGLPGSDLLEAMTDSHAALNSPDEFSGMKTFNGQIRGDRLVFPE